MHETFNTPAPISLFVELGSGSLTTEAIETAETSLEIKGPRAKEFHVIFDGRTLSVIAPHGRFFGRGDSHQVRLRVPTGSELITKMGSADTTTTGTLGALALKTGSGDIAVERVEGLVVIESGSGDIKGQEFADEVRIKSGSGDIDVRDVRGKTGISTGSGDVVLGTVYAKTVIKTGSGDLQVNRSEGDVSLTTASGDLTIGAAPRGKVTAKNVSGDVRVGIPQGTPVWTDISTVTGDVRNNLASAGKPGKDQDYVELRASTVSGDVHLRQI
jgi:DUF4097 and DUF4098 domain-containing protein YvlB